MRNLDPKDLDFLDALYSHSTAIVKASGGDPGGPHTWPQWVRVYDALAKTLVMRLRNHATLDDIELALEELTVQIEIWRIAHDPAYDPTLRAANDN